MTAVSYGPMIPLDGLSMLLDVGNRRSYPNSGSSLYDLTTNDNDITTTNVSYDSGNGGSFVYNGTTAYGYLGSPTLPKYNTDATIITWCVPYSSGAPSDTYCGLLGYGDRSDVTPSNSILLSLNTTGSTYYLSSAYWANDYVPNVVSVNKDEWNMCGMIARSAGLPNNTTLFVGNNTGISYVTGSSSAYARGLNISSTNLTVGCTDWGGSRFFKGKISVSMVYNRELLTSEIEQIFGAYRGRYGI